MGCLDLPPVLTHFSRVGAAKANKQAVPPPSCTCSEELLQLLEVLLMPAAEQGGWLLQWLWSHLYQVGTLHPKYTLNP